MYVRAVVTRSSWPACSPIRAHGIPATWSSETRRCRRSCGENAGTPAEADHERVWQHVATVLGALVVLQAETPRSIAEQAFGFCPAHGQWRDELLPRLQHAAE